MGALDQAMRRYGQKWTLDQSVTPDRMKKWFGDKLATKRSLEAMRFEKKAAVVFIGVSCIGKTTFMKRFVNSFPSFKMISYDECYNEAMNELKRDDNATELRMVEIVESRLEAYKDDNIIIDGKFLHPATRAALYEVLNKVYGYEIHVVYFSMEYVMENFPACAYSRAVQFALYGEYLSSLTKKQKKKANIVELDKVRENIIETTAAKRKVPVEVLCMQYAERADVVSRVEEYSQALMQEIKCNNLYSQYADGYFLYGADFFYEI